MIDRTIPAGTFFRCFRCYEAMIPYKGCWYCGDCDLVSGSEGEAGPDQTA